jgi:hypothetical protein
MRNRESSSNMQTYTVGYDLLPTPKDVEREARYIANPLAKSHKHHDVVDVKVWGPFATAALLIAALKEGLKLIASGIRRGRDIENTGIVRYIRFAPGTHLYPHERQRVERAVVAALELEKGGISAWHVHRTNGECDIHAIVPSIMWEPLPIARGRAPAPKLLLRCVVKVLKDLNNLRLEIGRPLIRFVKPDAAKAKEAPRPSKAVPLDDDMWPSDPLPPPLPQKKKLRPGEKPEPGNGPSM